MDGETGVYEKWIGGQGFILALGLQSRGSYGTPAAVGAKALMYIHIYPYIYIYIHILYIYTCILYIYMYIHIHTYVCTQDALGFRVRGSYGGG